MNVGRTDILYRPPAPTPTSPVMALLRGMMRSDRDMISLMPQSAYRTMVAEVGWTRRKIILVNDPEIVQQLMTSKVDEFPKSDLMTGALAPLVRDGVFVSDGEVWERQRRMIAPAFSHMRLGNAFSAMVQSFDKYEEIFDQRAEEGASFSLEEAMSHLTADVMCRTIFSRTLDTSLAQRVYRAFAAFQDSVANVRVFQLWLGRAHAEVHQPAAVVKSATEIRDLIGMMVDERIADSRDDLSDIAGDIIKARDPVNGSEFTREELIDQIGVFFLAGHETTAGALAWAFYILAHQPDAVRRIREEVEHVSSGGELNMEMVKKLEFTKAVFKETLRLYPPLGFIPRVAMRNGQMGDLKFPKGALVLIAPWLLHRHEALWENPDRFNPDRFAASREKAIPQGAYIPFGLGPRVCIGAAFAQVEATLILARVVSRYDMEIKRPEDVYPAARLTTRTVNGIEAKFTKRSL